MKENKGPGPPPARAGRATQFSRKFATDNTCIVGEAMANDYGFRATSRSQPKSTTDPKRTPSRHPTHPKSQEHADICAGKANTQ